MNQYERPPFRGATSPGPIGVDEIPPFTNKDVFARGKHNQLLRLCNALRRLWVNPPTAGIVRFSDRDAMIDLSPLVNLISGGGTGPPGTGSPITLYTFVSHPDNPDWDYVMASPQNPTGPAVKVLKPPLLRFSLQSHGNILYSQWNAANQTRLADGGGIPITQTITPNYVAGDTIYVVTVNNQLCDLNVDNRTFAGP